MFWPIIGPSPGSAPLLISFPCALPGLSSGVRPEGHGRGWTNLCRIVKGNAQDMRLPPKLLTIVQRVGRTIILRQLVFVHVHGRCDAHDARTMASTTTRQDIERDERQNPQKRTGPHSGWSAQSGERALL